MRDKILSNVPCDNCGTIGHEYKHCSEPITSWGIILVKLLDKDTDEKSKNTIDLKQFNNEFIKYINDKYEMNLKNLNLLFENKDPKVEIKIKELIKKFNNCYIKFIIVLIILITIICHIFYLEILR